LDLLLEKKLHTLKTTELIQLKYSLCRVPHYGRPKTHKILNDLLTEDSKSMDINQLIATFCAFRHESIRFQIGIIDKIIKNPLMLKEINNSPKLMVDFLRAYCTYPAETHGSVYNLRIFAADAIRHTNVINKLEVVKFIS
jgi:hypothetical protein